MGSLFFVKKRNFKIYIYIFLNIFHFVHILMTGGRHSDVGPETPAVENHTQRVQLRRTCGGGRPPAAGGHSGNMTFRWGVLHSQAGEGSDMFQFPFRKTSVTDWSTGGVNQLDSVGEHGNVLTEKSTGNGE